MPELTEAQKEELTKKAVIAARKKKNEGARRDRVILDADLRGGAIFFSIMFFGAHRHSFELALARGRAVLFNDSRLTPPCGLQTFCLQGKRRTARRRRFTPQPTS